MNEEKPVTSDNKKLSPEEIKRVKGLGCLQDKRYDDIFNIRVITGNGHITTDEHRAIADAADKFGNGQITMTTRLSMEINHHTFLHRPVPPAAENPLSVPPYNFSDSVFPHIGGTALPLPG